MTHIGNNELLQMYRLMLTMERFVLPNEDRITKAVEEVLA